MLQDLMNIEGVAVLSKQQQSAISGGDCYSVHYHNVTNPDGSTTVVKHLARGNKDQVVGEMTSHGGHGGRWCCASCDDASWL